MRWVKRTSLVLVLLILVAIGGGWAFLAASLPQTKGTLDLPGLEHPVSVVRDAQGVPTIKALSSHDLYLALGFVHAQDRLWQMDLQRRVAQGRLSEIFGADALGTDRYMRTLGLYRHAAGGVPFVSPEFKAVLDAYGQGINDFLASGKSLPIEFTLLNYRPDPWAPADSLVVGKLFDLQLAGNYRQELLHAKLAQTLSADQIADLFPDYPKDGPVALGKLAALTRDLPLDRMLAALPDEVGPRRASNDWVVDGAHSVTGKPLLANDPHLDYSAPLIWYLARLEAPDVTLAGVTVAGAPALILGHNDRIAWGYTTTNADVEDVFVEKIDPADPTRYLTPDGSAPFETVQEQIPVKGRAPVVLTVRGTRHGPVISDLADNPLSEPEAGTVLALQTSFLIDDDRSSEAQWRVGQARGWPSWIEALRLFTAPMQNMVYADHDGNIGFFAPGQIPIRKQGDGTVPVPGWSGEYDWAGWVPFEELPQAFNPASGHIATANNKIVPDDYPHLLTHDWDLPYRVERIEAGLAETPRQSIASSAAIQADTVSLTAKHLLPLMLAAPPADARQQAAMTLLSHWDARMLADRPEPLVFIAWLKALNKHLYQPTLGPLFDRYWSMRPLATEGVLTQHPQWCGLGGCAAALQTSLKDALDELTQAYGTDMAGWRWGTAHPALFAHPIFHRLPVLRQIFDRRVPADGSADTVEAGAFNFSNPDGPYTDIHGPALRAIYDLSDLDNSVFLTALGQSAHVLSAHYADLLPRWRAFDWLRLPHDPTGETLTLVPAKS
ncbi:MAG TPA: penicillin acylase family protein [Aliidongia sp.]|uniref:penicillin acylase family protein n=1 Tax=Aliidongia sp. TaxID=1914230 RepID=UPI002DDD819C|nr:penicillin acylase family protein [Aliidongia sp.]HEV2676894.1 penicillin acylase family protein [Aliidongia sp.]